MVSSIIIKPKPRKSFDIALHRLINPRLSKEFSVNLNGEYTLPRLLYPFKKTVFLDMDETLIKTSFFPVETPPPPNYSFTFEITIEDSKMCYYVLKRPNVDEFLKFLSEKFEVVVFTAAMEDYASRVIDQLDVENKLITHRLYRDSCSKVNGKVVKDLSETGRNKRSCVIVDDYAVAFSLNPKNGILIEPFIDDLEDNELMKLIPLFVKLENVRDVRRLVRLHKFGLPLEDEGLSDINDESDSDKSGADSHDSSVSVIDP